LNRAIQGAGYECTKKSSRERENIWGIEKLRAYIATVKSRFRPSLSHEASIILQKHYSVCRSSDDMAIQVTVRFLESLIRLAQAHASLMHRNVVQLDDAVAIILLMESSVASYTQNSHDSLYDDPTSEFPNDDVTDVDFLFRKARVLERYQMQHHLTPDEFKIIEEQGRMSNTEIMSNGWGNFEGSNHAMNSNCGNNMSSMPYDPPNMNSTQDHYGRLTQRNNSQPNGHFNFSPDNNLHSIDYTPFPDEKRARNR